MYSVSELKIQVNRTKKFQRIRGFGGSFTDSFGANLNSLSYDARENLLRLVWNIIISF